MYEVVGGRKDAINRTQRIPVEHVGAVHRHRRVKGDAAWIAHNSADRFAELEKLAHQPAADVSRRSGDEHHHLRTPDVTVGLQHLLRNAGGQGGDRKDQ